MFRTHASCRIWSCRWRGTLVAAKIIKTAKIRKDWTKKRAMEAIANGEDVDEAIKELDDADLAQDDVDLAVEDFRREISVLKSLRHPYVGWMHTLSRLCRWSCFSHPFGYFFLSIVTDTSCSCWLIRPRLIMNALFRNS